MKPGLSCAVIISCYNYADYVGQAIDSVLAQTRPADELIVVDDGSTDASREVIAGYGDRVRSLFQANAGQVAARNNGFRLSSADVILFLDADDLLEPDALGEIARRWIDGASKVQFDLEIIDADGRKIGRRHSNFRDGYGPAEVAAEFAATGTYSWPVMSGNAFARWFVESQLSVRPAECQDGLLNTLAPLYGPVVTIARPLGRYRLHGRNFSRRHDRARVAAYPDFAQRVRLRRAELAILRQQATARGVALPGGDPLDRELVFVNYRLMARGLGQAYPGDERDTRLGLWRKGITLAFRHHRSVKARASHAAWLTAIASSPPPLARALVQLRFSRAELLAAWRVRLLGRAARKGSA